MQVEMSFDEMISLLEDDNTWGIIHEKLTNYDVSEFSFQEWKELFDWAEGNGAEDIKGLALEKMMALSSHSEDPLGLFEDFMAEGEYDSAGECIENLLESSTLDMRKWIEVYRSLCETSDGFTEDLLGKVASKIESFAPGERRSLNPPSLGQAPGS